MEGHSRQADGRGRQRFRRFELYKVKNVHAT